MFDKTFFIFALTTATAFTAPSTPVTPTGTQLIVKSEDESFNVTILDEFITIQTPYGELKIPAKDITKIEFAHRCPKDDLQKIQNAINNLGHKDFKIREESTAFLKTMGQRAFPSVTSALKADDAEIAKRATDLVDYLKPLTQPHRPTDTIFTKNDKITGNITHDFLNVHTKLFGKQELKICELQLASKVKIQPALPAPINLTSFVNKQGTTITFTVLGTTTGTMWGDEIFSLDSTLAMAATYAGLVAPGETATITVLIVDSPPSFLGGIKNGVTSTPYPTPFSGGAYTFVK